MAGDKSSHASVHSEVQGAPVMLELTHNKGPADPASLVNKNDGGVTADEELDAIGLGRYHYIAGVICGLANAADAVELNAISYIILQLKDVSGTMKGTFLIACSLFGPLVTSSAPAAPHRCPFDGNMIQ